MQNLINSDLAAVFTEGFTVEATHQNGATNEALRVLFSNPNRPGLDNLAEVSGSSPSLLIQTADMVNVDRESTFTINSVVYSVIDIHPDQSGVTRIFLSEDQEG